MADLDASEYNDELAGEWISGSHRRAIEGGFETARNELGLDHNQTRSRLAAIVAYWIN